MIHKTMHFTLQTVSQKIIHRGKKNIGKVKEKNKKNLEIQILGNTVNSASYEIFGGVFS